MDGGTTSISTQNLYAYLEPHNPIKYIREIPFEGIKLSFSVPQVPQQIVGPKKCTSEKGGNRKYGEKLDAGTSSQVNPPRIWLLH